jgi:hypothetical protein
MYHTFVIEYEEPCEARVSSTVPWEREGEIPSRDPIILSFTYNKREPVSFWVVDMLGNRVVKPKEYHLFAGQFHIKLPTSELPPGIYFVQSSSDVFKEKALKVVKL